MKSFYQNFVNLELFHQEFDRLGLSPEEREELFKILEEIYVQRLIDRVLDELPNEEKKKFMKILIKKAELDMIEFLREKVEDVENKLKKEVETLTAELLLEVKSLR